MASTNNNSTFDNSNNNKGFFKKMRMRRNKNHDNKVSTTPTKSKKMRSPLSFSPTRSNKNDSTMNSNTVPPSPPNVVLQTRRVIKATRPPSPTTDVSSIMSSSNSYQDNSLYNTTASVVVTARNENLKEKTEMWRQERMTKSAAIQKSNKEKEIMQHRMKSVKASEETGDDSAASGGAGDEEKKDVQENKKTMEISEIFKTRTFHPENKRKVSSDDHVEKKSKLDNVPTADDKKGDVLEEENDESEALVEIETTKRSCTPFWMKVAAPTAIVAVCAVVMMKTLFLKKKR